MMSRWHLILGAVFALSLVSTSVSAQSDAAAMRRMAEAEGASMDADAQSHFRVGLAFYREARFRDAAREFEAAYTVSHRVDLLYNMYIAYRDAGDWINAYQALKSYLDLSPQTISDRAALTVRLHNMAESLESHGIHLNPDGSVNMDAPAAEPAPAAAPVPTPEETAAAAAAAAPPAPPPAEPTHHNIVSLSLIGVGGAALIAGAVTGGLTAQKASQLSAMCTDYHCPASALATHDSAKTLATMTDALLIGGAVAFVAGATMYFLWPDVHHEEPATTVSAMCVRGACAANLSVRF